MSSRSSTMSSTSILTATQLLATMAGSCSTYKRQIT